MEKWIMVMQYEHHATVDTMLVPILDDTNRFAHTNTAHSTHRTAPHTVSQNPTQSRENEYDYIQQM